MSEQLQLRRGTASQVAAFTGAQGEVVCDTTNNRLVVNDGRPSAARRTQSSPRSVTNSRTAVSTSPTRLSYRSHGRLHRAHGRARRHAAGRRARIPTGTRLLIVDESGNCSVTKTLTVNAAGTDHDRWRRFGGRQSGLRLHRRSRAMASAQWTIIDQGFMPATVNLAAARAWRLDPECKCSSRQSPSRALPPTLRCRSRRTASSWRSARAS